MLFPDVCLICTTASAVTPFWLLVLIKCCKFMFVPVKKSVLPRTVNLLKSSVIPSAKGKELASSTASWLWWVHESSALWLPPCASWPKTLCPECVRLRLPMPLVFQGLRTSGEEILDAPDQLCLHCRHLGTAMPCLPEARARRSLLWMMNVQKLQL